MIQKKKEKEVKKEDDLDEIRTEFNKPRVTKRKVTLYYQECCGCGCTDVAIEREVPGSSDLKDGDHVYTLETGDRMSDD